VILLLDGSQAAARPSVPARTARYASGTPSPELVDLVDRIAEEFGVGPRALMVRTRLHLPRLTRSLDRANDHRVRRAIRLCASRLGDETRRAAAHVPVGPFALCDLRFEQIEEERARPLLLNLHYLRTVHPGSLYFGLVEPVGGLPIALCSLSTIEWPRLVGGLSRFFGLRSEEVWDVSRMYSLDDAPANSISFLLARVRNWVRVNRPDVTTFTTVVDPNLGFTGSSYRAANWQQWMTIQARPYLYDNGWFVTPRQLRDRYRTSNFEELKRLSARRFEKSRMPLSDSLLFGCRLDGVTTVPTVIPRLHR
jgi:hypothetical protein